MVRKRDIFVVFIFGVSILFGCGKIEKMFISKSIFKDEEKKN